MNNPFAQQAAPQAPAANPFGGGQAAPQQSVPAAPEAPAQAANPFGGQAPQQPALQAPAANPFGGGQAAPQQPALQAPAATTFPPAAPQQAPAATTFPPAAPQQAPAAAASPFGGGQAATNDPFGAPGSAEDPFAQPEAGGGGGPKMRDLQDRLVMFRVLERGKLTDAYKAKDGEKVSTTVVDVAVLDGPAPVMISPSREVGGPPTVYSETVPCVSTGMWISQKGMVRLLSRRDLILGRVTYHPSEDIVSKNVDYKDLAAQVPHATPPQILAEMIRRNPALDTTGSYWTLEKYTEQDAALARAFLAANPRFLG